MTSASTRLASLAAMEANKVPKYLRHDDADGQESSGLSSMAKKVAGATGQAGRTEEHGSYS